MLAHEFDVVWCAFENAALEEKARQEPHGNSDHKPAQPVRAGARIRTATAFVLCEALALEGPDFLSFHTGST
jgi:hypothetical protein